MTTEERLARLEKELARGRRFSRWLLAALGVSLGAWVVAGALGPATGADGAGTAVREIRASKFILEDDNGKPRAVLGATKDGPGLDLRDEKGGIRVLLTVDKDGPTLALIDQNGKHRATLAVDKNGPMLDLWHENGKVTWHAP